MSRFTHLQIAGLVALLWAQPSAAQVLQTPPAEPSTEEQPEAASDEEDPATDEQTQSVESPPAQKQEQDKVLIEEPEDDDPYFLKDPRPSSGLGMIIPGWIFLGTGIANLITLPLCRTDAVQEKQQDLCVGVSLAFAIGGTALGVPLLVAGYDQRAEYKAWRQRHPHAWLLNTQVALTPGGAAVFYQGSF